MNGDGFDPAPPPFPPPPSPSDSRAPRRKTLAATPDEPTRGKYDTILHRIAIGAVLLGAALAFAAGYQDAEDPNAVALSRAITALVVPSLLYALSRLTRSAGFAAVFAGTVGLLFAASAVGGLRGDASEDKPDDLISSPAEVAETFALMNMLIGEDAIANGERLDERGRLELLAAECRSGDDRACDLVRVSTNIESYRAVSDRCAGRGLGDAATACTPGLDDTDPDAPIWATLRDDCITGEMIACDLLRWHQSFRVDPDGVGSRCGDRYGALPGLCVTGHGLAAEE